MNFNGRFNYLGSQDITAVKQLVLRVSPQEWLRENSHQQKYGVHNETQTISLVYDEDFRHIDPTRHPALEIFADAIRPLLVLVSEHYDNTALGLELREKHGQGYCIRANLVRLNPGKTIEPHQDKNFSLAHSHRVHVPIITNDEVFFTVGGESINMREGDVVEINNRLEHSVENQSGDGRVHLIFDWVIAGEQCCCSSKTHPGIPCSSEACIETDRLNISCECFLGLDV